jgi:hypothetical protein
MDRQALIEPEQPISRGQLIHLLDSEIHLISEQKKKEGWTSLAVVGALGTLFNSVTSDTIVWTNSLTFFLIIQLVFFGYMCLKHGIAQSREELPSNSLKKGTTS